MPKKWPWRGCWQQEAGGKAEPELAGCSDYTQGYQANISVRPRKDRDGSLGPWVRGQGQLILCHHANIQRYKEFRASTVQLALKVNMENVYQNKCMEHTYSVLHLLDIQLLSV